MTENSVVPEISYSDLEFFERLSSGSYGTVYRAKWISRDKIVAVKKVLVLEKEAQVLSLIRHKNIIQFFGAVSEQPNFCIVLEFAAKGSLYSFVHESNTDIQFACLLQWAREIALGVHYLHFEAPVNIIHRDLKSGNVVISEGGVCKICDFGTSKPFVHTAQMTTVGTIPWMSPEMIQRLPVSETTDTWSYAVVLWELLTREVPFNGCESFRIAWMIVEENVRLCVPSTCPSKLAKFLERCWNKDATQRPSFKQILEVLQDLADDKKSSSETEIFLTQKCDWLHEIEEHVIVLKAKEKSLIDWEAKLGEWERRLTRREQNMENSRRMSHVTNPVKFWNEYDVANWFQEQTPTGGSTGGGNIQSPNSSFFNRFRDYGIDGSRLLLITDNDLRRMGMSDQFYRGHLLGKIRGLLSDRSCAFEFPVLTEENDFKPESSGFIDLTILFGIYVREGINNQTHKWKMLMDLDDVIDYENGLELIDHVTFTVSETGHVFKFSKAPFIMDKWMVGFKDGQNVDCEVHFSNLISNPRSEKINYSIDCNRRDLLHEHYVKLSLKFDQPENRFGMHRLMNSRIPSTEAAWQNFKTSSFEVEKSASPHWIFSDLNRDQCGFEKAAASSMVLRKKSDALLLEHQNQMEMAPCQNSSSSNGSLNFRKESLEHKRELNVDQLRLADQLNLGHANEGFSVRKRSQVDMPFMGSKFLFRKTTN